MKRSRKSSGAVSPWQIMDGREGLSITTMQSRKKKRRAGKVLAALAAAIVLTGLCLPAAYSLTDRAIPGVSYNGVRVSGMTREELGQVIERQAQSVPQGRIQLHYKGVKENIDLRPLSVHLNKTGEEDRILGEGREAGLVDNWKIFWKSVINGLMVPARYSFNEQSLEQQIAGIVKKYGEPTEEAKPHISANGTVTFGQGRPYLQIDREKLSSMLVGEISSGSRKDMELPVLDEDGAFLDTEKAARINHVLASYTTTFALNPNRSNNIRLAAESINGEYIPPGQTFSFNRATGKRIAERGYKEAPVLIAGKLVPGAGGGVCQVSTTLFNAVLLSGLKVRSRSNHFSPVHYVPLGRDATVADGIIDFRFINSLPHPVYIYAKYEPGRLTVYLLGNELDTPSAASVEETQKETIPHGTVEKSDPQQQAARTVEKGHDGYRVTVSRKVEWPDGRTLTDSFRSEYKAVPDVIIHGNPSVQPDKTARKQMTGTNVKQETEGTQKEKQKTVS